MESGLRSDRVVQLRKERGMTQYDLADALGIQQNQVSRYERGLVNTPLHVLITMADLFNTTTDYLLGRSNIPHPGTEPDPNPDLTPDEIDLLQTYRRRSPANQKLLLGIAKLMDDTQGEA